jgi:uncharacterized RDD family membrane protein YckC
MTADSGVVRRLAAALVTGAFQVLVLAVTVWAATRLLPAGAQVAWLPAAVFSLLWSGASTVLTLAFFRRTVGMAVCGIEASGADRGPLSFGQAFRRWLGALFTVALAGLPGLLGFTGRSFTDRVSGSRTVLG